MPEVVPSHPILNSRLVWHPKFSVNYIDQVGLLLLSRSGSVEQPIFLPDHAFSKFTCFEQPCVLAELIELDAEFASPDVFYVIQQLLDADILVESEQLGLDYISAENINVHTASVDSITSHSRQVTAELLAQFRNEFYKSREGQADFENLKIVFIDDFLLLNQKKVSIENTMFVQLSSDDVLIFPCLDRQDDEYLNRLKHRILKNQPMRYALSQHKNSDQAVSVPVKRLSLNQSHIDLIVELVFEQARDELSSLKKLVEISVEELAVKYHTITLTVFQEDALASGKNHSAIKLQSVEGLNSAEGGTRVVSAEETYESLRYLVSPITGVINQFYELPTQYHDNIKVFQSGFFKIPKLSTLTKPQAIHQELQQVCLGKGVSVTQSKVSALSEAIERRNAVFDQPVNCLSARVSDLKATEQRFYEYQDLVPYSDAQYKGFIDPLNPESKRKQAAIKYNDETIQWVENWSLSHNEIVYLPLTACQAQTGSDQEKFGRWHSNGCSAGNCLEEAILQGLFELIERDATSIWWYNKINFPAFDLMLLKSSDFERFNESLHVHYDYWVLDLTNDVGVPVMAAIAQHRVSGGFVMGFGAHLKPVLAAQRALSELCQLIPIRDQHSAPFDFDKMEEESYLFPCLEKSTTEYLECNSHILNENIENIIHRLLKLDLETLVFDYSKSDTPLSTVKVTVPGLCHIWPQYANKRLYEVPAKMGWRPYALKESELNAQALYI